jgi:hypothetical protein
MKLSLQQWANIFKIVAVIIFIAIILSVSSCGSANTIQHKNVEVAKPQFIIVNNEILMFENN